MSNKIPLPNETAHHIYIPPHMREQFGGATSLEDVAVRDVKVQMGGIKGVIDVEGASYWVGYEIESGGEGWQVESHYPF